MIEQAGYKNNRLVTFNWYVTNFCNYRCTYCAEHQILTKKISEIELQAYRKVIPIMKSPRIDNFSVELIGGEPTLHPELKHIIKKLDGIDRDKFIYCELITNLSRTVDYFKDLFDGISSRFVVKPSYHPEYYNKKFTNKILELSKTLKIRPTIVISDDQTHAKQTCQFLDSLIDNEIEYDLQMLYCTEIYEANYTEHIEDVYKKYFDHNRSSRSKYMTEWSLSEMSEDIPYVINNKTTALNMNDIKKLDKNKFKGYKCTPNYWEISSTGEIVNSCTREKLKFDASNVYKRITCPIATGCHELHKLYYHKTIG